ncbi:MAG TPA: biotin/lipoyl-binding protein [Terriglobia bacterium]|nr:biotin/lipoyl-binding protein [Terriglobia bacterium]
MVVLLAAALVATITRNWNAWEGGRVEQVTDDAYVRGDITPLGTNVAGVVRNVKVSDYQQVHRGDILLRLEDDDYKAEVAQANAAVEAARAAIDDNQRQREVEIHALSGRSRESTRPTLRSQPPKMASRQYEPTSCAPRKSAGGKRLSFKHSIVQQNEGKP